MVSLNHSVAINYFGGSEILTHPLYVKWSQKTIADINSAKSDLQTDMGLIIDNMDNLAIISYLSTLIRAVELQS